MTGYYNSVIFFFSNKRRHTSWNCDWSSDVCSSDLKSLDFAPLPKSLADKAVAQLDKIQVPRSEERRVGKEWSCRRPAYNYDNVGRARDCGCPAGTRCRCCDLRRTCRLTTVITTAWY